MQSFKVISETKDLLDSSGYGVRNEWNILHESFGLTYSEKKVEIWLVKFNLTSQISTFFRVWQFRVKKVEIFNFFQSMAV